jgi:pimeloyl-ACP methyl ester carboxylesterase
MEFTLDGKAAVAGTGGRAPHPAEPVVVLVHGAGMDHTVFALQARALAHHGRRVLAFDLPGHGKSAGPALTTIEAMADWVLRAASACGAERFRIAGHSMGALVALEAAARGGARVDALALLGIVPEMRVHPDLLEAARRDVTMAAAMMTSWSFGAAGQRGGNPAPGLWLPGGAQRLIERADAAALAADLAACAAYRGAAAAAASVRCPVLLVLGGQDRMTPAAEGRRFGVSFSERRIEVLEAAGHMMMLEQPAATLALLRETM